MASSIAADNATAANDGARPFHIWLLIGSGVVAAAQIGKAIISMPLIRADMALSLGFAGLLVATFATLGALTGIGAGVVTARIGTRRALIGGMATIAVGNLIGALATNEIMLLAARIIEGTGFFGTVLAIPSMLAQIVTRERRDFVMAVWSAYMPAGIMIMLLAAPILAVIGWRNLWLANAAFAGALSVLLAFHAPELPRAAVAAGGDFISRIAGVMRRPQCLIVAFAFFAYSCQIFSLAFALPTLLTAQHGVTLGSAGLMSGIVLAASAVGHVSSGFLLRRGIPIWANTAIAFAFFAVSGLLVYSSHLPPLAVAVVAALALAIGGLAPGALYAAAPHAAPSPQAVPPTIGLIQQASNLGQFAGPVTLGFWVERFSWETVPAIDVPAALIGFAAAFAIRETLLPDKRTAGKAPAAALSSIEPKPCDAREARPAAAQ
jgi:predicted MFS family arabinose efflux permease